MKETIKATVTLPNGEKKLVYREIELWDGTDKKTVLANRALRVDEQGDMRDKYLTKYGYKAKLGSPKVADLSEAEEI